jgi:hypothetical protein
MTHTTRQAREELVGLDAFGGKEEKIDDDFLGYANLMVRRVFEVPYHQLCVCVYACRVVSCRVVCVAAHACAV